MPLGSGHYKSYNQLALEIRNSKTKQVYYYGDKILPTLCSGDVAQILDIVKRMFEIVGGPKKFSEPRKVSLPLARDIQNRAIQEVSKDFLNKIENAPKSGPVLREISEAFGEVANWYLMNRNSKNEERYPPWQAFRIEIRDRIKLSGNNLETYSELLRYGVFFRDIRGKSQRGVVAPRLYLRRLLIPTFRLTPSKRDNVGLNSAEFLMLLEKPEDFKDKMMRKKPKRKKFQPNEKQKTLNYPEKRFLFSISCDFKKELKNNKISDKLKHIFKDNGCSLSIDAKISTKSNTDWKISDGENEYFIEESDNQLDVHEKLFKE